MKNNKGITLIALIITIIVMSIIVGISVSGGSDVFQKSKMTDYIGYMRLVKARADVVIEDEIFNAGEPSNSVNSFEESDVTNTIADKGYYIPTMQTIKWEQGDIASQGIDKSILGSDEYFVVVYDTQTMETRDVLYSEGCGLEGQRYYSLNDMETVISGGTPTVATTRAIVNLIENGDFSNGFDGWFINGKQDEGPQISTEFSKFGTNSFKKPITSNIPFNYLTQVPLAGWIENHNYYVSLYAYNPSETSSEVNFDIGNTSCYDSKTINVNDGWTKLSAIYTSDGVNRNIAVNYATTTAITYIDGVSIIDLTTTFAGREEPEEGWKNWCDENLDYGVTEVEVPQN